jgi:cysteine desulfurase/selenocysteine lyase
MISLGDIKKDFPILEIKINGKRLVYLDSAASSLKPKPVLEALERYYLRFGVNIFRGLYRLSLEATEEYEKSREKVAKFIGAKDSSEVIFVRNTTEAINLLASSLGEEYLKKGDEILLTIMEHHSNFVPWQQLSLNKGLNLKIWDINKEGTLKEIPLGKKTKILAITYVSNVLGTINPLDEIIKKVRKINKNCLVVIDGAQAVPHLKVDVSRLDCDFLAFSGHKMLGPTGIGVLWGKRKLLTQMPPYQFGGEMIKEVYLKKTNFADLPAKFEAGTPNIAGAIGLGAAVDYLESLGIENIRRQEEKLTKILLDEFKKIKEITVYGPLVKEKRGGVVSFNLKRVHPHDLGQILNEDNICIRTGHHCTMPLHQRLGIPASCRASFYIYNDEEDIEALIVGIKKAKSIFRL